MLNFGLDNIVKEPTCFKNPNNPSCIDLILTNRKQNLQNTTVFENSIFDFHKMVLTVIKSRYIRAKPRVIFYRDYKKIDRNKFCSNLEINFTLLHHSPQHCLVVMIEKRKICLDSKGIAGALLTDLSKAFDCLAYDLLIAKLNIYGFYYSALKLIFNYLSNRKQRTRIDATISNWVIVKIGVPQGSIMGPL